jgi:hypothetical protein
VSWLLLLTPLLPWMGLLPGGRWALPLLAPLTLYPAFVARVRRRDYLGAWSFGLLWALLLSAGVIVLVSLRAGGAGGPGGAGEAMLHGEAYRKEMFGWIATGEAPENHPAVFIPIHLLHLGVFVLLAWASAGYLGLVLGAFLVDYMSYFVGSYAVASAHPLLGSIAAWVPWSVVRVFAFVLLGCLFARPLLLRRAWPFEKPEYRLLGLAAGGLAVDIVLKTLLAPSYGLFLRQLARSASLAP